MLFLNPRDDHGVPYIFLGSLFRVLPDKAGLDLLFDKSLLQKHHDSMLEDFLQRHQYCMPTYTPRHLLDTQMALVSPCHSPDPQVDQCSYDQEHQQ